MWSRPNSRITGAKYNGLTCKWNGRSGMYNAVQSALSPIFAASLTTSAVPEIAKGSATPTFTRATTKYIVDFEGLYKTILSGEVGFSGARRVRNILATTSENFSNAAWTKDATATVTAGQTDPFGGTSAYKIDNVTAGEGIFNSTSVATSTKTARCWLKGAVGGEVVTLGGGGLNVTLTSSWALYSTTGSADGFCRIRAQAANKTIYAYQCMQEDVTGQTNQNPSEYVSVGVLSSPYHGAMVDGVKYFSTLNGNTVSSNVVTEATGAAINSSQGACAGGVTAGVVDASGPVGYNSEPAATNLALWCRDLTNGAWVSGGGGIATAKTAVGADGAANAATTLTASGANGTLLQTITDASAQRITGCLIKRRTGTGTIQMTQDNGATWTTVIVTASYTQVSIPAATLTNPIIGFKIVTAADAIDVDFVMHQLGAVITSPIATTTVAVTRNADVLTYASAGNFNTSTGAVYLETVFAEALNSPSSVFFCDTSLVGTPLYAQNNRYTVYDGTNILQFGTAISPPVTSPVKIVSSWGGSNLLGCVSGGTVGSTSFDGAMQMAVIGIGCAGTTNQPKGNIRNVRIYGQALSAAQLQAMTA